MKWLRLYPEARTDAKLKSLRDSEHRVWFNLLCLAAEQEERGHITGYTPYLLALEVARGNEGLLERTLEKLVGLCIVTRRYSENNDDIVFIHFAERQYTRPSDQPEQVRIRVQKHRKRARNDHVTRETPVTTAEQNRTEQRQNSDPSDRAAAAPPKERFFTSRQVNGQVAAVIDLFTVHGHQLDKQDRQHLGRMVKKRGHGAAVFKAAEVAANEEGVVGSRIEYMERVITNEGLQRGRQRGTRKGASVASTEDFDRAKQGEW